MSAKDHLGSSNALSHNELIHGALSLDPALKHSHGDQITLGGAAALATEVLHILYRYDYYNTEAMG